MSHGELARPRTLFWLSNVISEAYEELGALIRIQLFAKLVISLKPFNYFSKSLILDFSSIKQFPHITNMLLQQITYYCNKQNENVKCNIKYKHTTTTEPYAH